MRRCSRRPHVARIFAFLGKTAEKRRNAMRWSQRRVCEGRFPLRCQAGCFSLPCGRSTPPWRDSESRTRCAYHVYRAPKEVCCDCALREQGAPPGARPTWRRSITRIAEPPATTAFKAKMKTEEAQKIYAQRSQVAEFAHAWIKERCGLRPFRCQDRLKATMEATWACLTYNLRRWFGLQRALQARAAIVACRVSLRRCSG
jgi:hypothetical protein